jgi:hypothetical protein
MGGEGLPGGLGVDAEFFLILGFGMYNNIGSHSSFPQ